MTRRSLVERCLAVGLLVVALLGAAVAVERLFRFRAEIAADSARAAALRDDYKAAIAAASSSAGSRPEALDLVGDRLTAGTDAAAAGELQRLLAAIVQAERIELSSAQTLPPKASVGGPTIGIRLQVRGSIDRVQHLLHAIEVHRPWLFVEKATLRPDPTLAGGMPMSGLEAVRLVADIEILAVRAESSTQAKRP